MTIVLPFMPSPNFYPGRTRQIRVLVMHSVEGPMTAGLAKSLAGPNWFGSTVSRTSANAIFDPTGGIEMVKPGDVAWEVGNANQWSYGTEHCGYAAFSAAQWLTADGKKMLTASALWNRQIATEQGIPWRRLTQDEMRAGQRGLCTHDDCRVVWGGTTHTDPQWSQDVWDFYLAAGSGSTPPPVSTSPPTTGDVLDMDEKQLSDLIDQRLKVAFGNDYAGADLAKVVAAGPVSTRSATKVRDMKDGGTGALYAHSLTQGTKLQALLDHFGIKIPGATE